MRGRAGRHRTRPGWVCPPREPQSRTISRPALATAEAPGRAGEGSRSLCPPPVPFVTRFRPPDSFNDRGSSATCPLCRRDGPRLTLPDDTPPTHRPRIYGMTE